MMRKYMRFSSYHIESSISCYSITVFSDLQLDGLFVWHSQNVELLLEFVQGQLKTKIFLVHIKVVQIQLANTKQCYIVIYYFETNDIITAIQLARQSKNYCFSFTYLISFLVFTLLVSLSNLFFSSDCWMCTQLDLFRWAFNNYFSQECIVQT